MDTLKAYPQNRVVTCSGSVVAEMCGSKDQVSCGLEHSSGSPRCWMSRNRAPQAYDGATAVITRAVQKAALMIPES